MKALTLTQPWATLLALGEKHIETRSWSTSYRGPIADHAAKAFPKWARDTCLEDPFWSALGGGPLHIEDRRRIFIPSLPLGAVLATCNLLDCIPTEMLLWVPEKKTFVSNCWPVGFEIKNAEWEHAFGDFSEGRFAWMFGDIKQLDAPIPARGALGLWEWAEN